MGLEQPRSDFWSATPQEFWAFYDWKFGNVQFDEPLTRNELQELMEKYPDEK